MMLHVQDNHSYGDSQADLLEYLKEYSSDNYSVEHQKDAVCSCGNTQFQLYVDEEEGVAVRKCVACGNAHPIGDSEDYMEDASPELSECVCGSTTLQVTVGVALYRNSRDVKWVYIGGYCPTCGLVGCYGDWKNEYSNYEDYLNRI